MVDSEERRGGGFPPGAIPASRIDPRDSRYGQGARPARPGKRDPDTGMLLDGSMSLGEVEERLQTVDAELEDLVRDHWKASEDLAEAKANWERHRDINLVLFADSGVKESADLRLARAKQKHSDPRDLNSPTGEDLYRLYLVLAAREDSISKAMTALKQRAMILQTIARGIRGVT